MHQQKIDNSSSSISAKVAAAEAKESAERHQRQMDEMEEQCQTQMAQVSADHEQKVAALVTGSKHIKNHLNAVINSCHVEAADGGQETVTKPKENPALLDALRRHALKGSPAAQSLRAKLGETRRDEKLERRELLSTAVGVHAVFKSLRTVRRLPRLAFTLRARCFLGWHRDS